MSEIVRAHKIIPGVIFSQTSIDGDVNLASVRNSGVSARRELSVPVVLKAPDCRTAMLGAAMSIELPRGVWGHAT